MKQTPKFNSLLIQIYLGSFLTWLTVGTFIILPHGSSSILNHPAWGMSLIVLTALWLGITSAAIRRQQKNLSSRDNMAHFSSKIAHDLRSPLVSLQAIAHGANGLDQNSRNHLRAAVDRIRDIANNLANEFVGDKTIQQESGTHRAIPLCSQQNSIELLPALLENCISQMRAQNSKRDAAEIDLQISDQAQFVFSEVDPKQLSRIIAALAGQSDRSLVALTATQYCATIKIQVTSGMLHNESSSAVSTVESWGGRIFFEPNPGAWTTATLEIPLTYAPRWFAGQIKITVQFQVVVIDDDPTIHQLWDCRLKSLIHLRSPQELLAWYRAHLGTDAIYFCDYEFEGVNQTGIDIIEMIGTAETSILVTSRWNDPYLQQRCEKIGLKILPKNLVDKIPIEME